MTSNREDVVDQAIAWHLHLEEASAEEWHDFVEWLSADEAHAAAYDRVALDDASLTPAMAPVVSVPPSLPMPANDVQPIHRRRWFAPAAGGAIAAALCAALLLPAAQKAGQPYSVTTPAGMSREVVLEDGTRIEMNGGTVLTLDHADPRTATLDRGEAVFHVTHDAAHPFELKSGKATIRDLGTVFNVTRAGARLDIGVAEGAVMFEPQHEGLTLRPGMQLQSSEDAGRVTIRHVDAESVGGWRHGQLSFRETPMAEVAEAVERSTAAHIAISPGLAAVPFTGVVRLAGGADAVIPRVARLSGAHWSHDGNTWSLTPGHSESR